MCIRDSKRVGLRMFYAPVAAVERIVFRTGVPRTFPTVDTPVSYTHLDVYKRQVLVVLMRVKGLVVHRGK